MFIVYDENMNIKPFPHGVTPLDIYIPSINKRRIKDEPEGVHGYVDKGYTYGTRNIEVILRSKNHDPNDYRYLRDEIFTYFSENDYLYISEEHQPGKRYKVTADESFIPERINRKVASVGMTLEMADLPFAESIGTTQDIQADEGISERYDLWQRGMGLLPDKESYIYTHTDNTFRIYNAGTARIHPYRQELKIIISGVVNSTSFLQLKNVRNGTTFRLNEGLPNGQTLVIEGASIQINSLNALRKTNRQFIELEPGWNDFILTGASGGKKEFQFRFYYL